MIETLPIYVPLLFIATVLITLVWFYKAAELRRLLFLIMFWAVAQSFIALNLLYVNEDAMPPRLMLGMLPILLAIPVFFLTKRGRRFMDNINLKTLTWMHIIRIPVEITLAMLYHEEMISVLQTFEGTNFDIFSGITAPLMAWYAFKGGEVKKKLLLGWNILCLALLLNVVITSALALPSPMQQLAFDQPNVGILYFPFILLPTVVVPIVLFAHLVAIRRLTKKNTSQT